MTLEGTGKPVHKVTVMIVDSGQTTVTDEEGNYSFELPPGSYTVLAYTANLTTASEDVQIAAGQSQELDFVLGLTPLRTEITVTAAGKQETAFDAVQSVISVDTIDLAGKPNSSLGEVLNGELGVSKRSFGPGSSRPVVRGFTGDRVMILQDGLGVGSVGSQSGDHGEPVDAANLDRVEVVKGPATLLYGSNAVGGVVNAVSGHFDVNAQSREGLEGRISSVAGSNNAHLGTGASVEYGTGNWTLWAGGGANRSGDYHTAEGTVENSKSRLDDVNGGLGWYGRKAFAAFDYGYSNGRYGIPFANEFEGLDAIDLDFNYRTARFSGGFRDLQGPFRSFRLSLNYSRWRHDEIEILGGEQNVGTHFDNQHFVYEGVLEQAKRGKLSGSFGFWGRQRDYKVAGEEALSPPVDQSSFAVFGLEEFDLERVKVQFGARVEHSGYSPQAPVLRGGEGEDQELVTLPDRGFTGFSGGIGARFDLWNGGAFVANFVSSFRAPALEELYNLGPHAGNLAFEVGDPDLKRERSNGIDLSLRHLTSRIRAEANFFYYDISDFVFLAPTGAIEDGLLEAEYLQGDSRFLGAEARFDAGINEYLWLNFAVDSVRAELKDSGESLPRIPPWRAHFGVDLRYKGLSVQPGMVVGGKRTDIFSTETPTGGYTVFNLSASYTLTRQHLAHYFTFNIFNLGDHVYRNHVSFIKDQAPEIGRAVSVGYVVNFF